RHSRESQDPGRPRRTLRAQAAAAADDVAGTQHRGVRHRARGRHGRIPPDADPGLCEAQAQPEQAGQHRRDRDRRARRRRRVRQSGAGGGDAPRARDASGAPPVRGDLLLRSVRVAGAGRELLPTDEPVDILIRAGVIADIAPAGNLRAAVEEIDGDGTWVIPGLWDHHVHTVQWALDAQRVQLGGADTPSEAARIVAGAAALPDGRMVGAGFRDGLWSERPTLALLDEVTGARPAYLINADVHSMWLNSAALRREGFDGRDDDGMLRE